QRGLDVRKNLPGNGEKCFLLTSPFIEPASNARGTILGQRVRHPPHPPNVACVGPSVRRHSNPHLFQLVHVLNSARGSICSTRQKCCRIGGRLRAATRKRTARGSWGISECNLPDPVIGAFS